MQSTKKIDILNWGTREDSWEPLGQQGDKTSQSYRNQPGMLIGRTDAEAEAPILWPSVVNSQLIGKTMRESFPTDTGED